MTKKELFDLQNMTANVLKKDITVELIHGYLTAVAAAPELIKPSEWMPFIMDKNNKKPDFNSAEEAESLIRLIMNMYNETASEIADGGIKPLYLKREANDITGAAGRWCRGFLEGFSCWGLASDKDKTIKKLITPFIFLGYKEELLNALDKESGDYRNAGKITEEYLNVIPENVIALKEHCRYDEPENTTEYQKTGKTGRNQPCPCGSGKKYKHCCGG